MCDYDAQLGLLIGGRWRAGDNGQVVNILNPATGDVLAELPLASESDLDLALDQAELTFRHWRDVSGTDRGGVLRRAAALLRERRNRIAKIATLEQGKISSEARDEVTFAAALLDFHAGEAERIYGRILPRPAGSRSLVLHQSIGPVAAFCAWNFPILNVVRKLSPALAAGGGQMLRAGLACVLGVRRPPQLLILDEPTNHLDIDSVQAIETALAAYDGTLLLVSHDEMFITNVGVSRRLDLSARRPAGTTA